jgi:hypothetical protein
MRNNKQQTALSFFLMGLIDLEIGKGISTDKVIELHYLFDKAKEMEKERLTDAYHHGKNNGMDISHPWSKTKEISAEEWYNETYGE